MIDLTKKGQHGNTIIVRIYPSSINLGPFNFLSQGFVYSYANDVLHISTTNANESKYFQLEYINSFTSTSLYLEISGTPGLNVSWFIKNFEPNQENRTFSRSLGDPFGNPFTLPLSSEERASNIIFTGNGHASLRLVEIPKDDKRLYGIQTNLNVSKAFSLSITSENDTFDIHDEGEQTNEPDTTLDPLEPPFDIIPSVTIRIPHKNYVTADQLVDSINQSILAFNIDLYVSYIPFDNYDTNLIRLVWASNTRKYSILGNTANSVTLGNYSFDSDSGAEITMLDVPNINPISPICAVGISPVILQWPIDKPLYRSKNPGSSNTDGLVIFSSLSSTEKRIFRSRKDPYIIYNTEFVISGLNINYEKITLYMTTLDETHSEILEAYVNDSQVQIRLYQAMQFQDSISLSLPIYTDFHIEAKSNNGDIYERFFIKVSDSERLIGNRVFFENPDLPGQSQFQIDAWAGGGGNISNGSQISYGGASSHLKYVINLQFQVIQIWVGQKGIQLHQNYASGGTQTRIDINERTIFQIGAGGGASSDAHGGNGGCPAIDEPYFSNGNNNDTFIYFNGSDAIPNSLRNSALNTQVLGKGYSVNSSFDNAWPIFSTSQGSTLNLGPAATGGQGFGGSVGQIGINGYGQSGGILPGYYGGGGGGSTVILNLGALSHIELLGPLEENLEVVDFSEYPPFTVNSENIGGGYGMYDNDLPYSYSVDAELCDSYTLMTLYKENYNLPGVLNQNYEFLKAIVNDAIIDPKNINISPRTCLFGQTNPISVGPYDQPYDQSRSFLCKVIEFVDNGSTICFRNEGQISEDDVPYIRNTSITNLETNEVKHVLRAYMDLSPDRSANAMYLVLHQPVENMASKADWDWKCLPFRITYPESVVFTNCVSVFGSGARYWNKLLNVQDIQLQYFDTLRKNLYDLMSRTFIHSTTTSMINPQQIFEHAVFPKDYGGSFEYLQKIWPISIGRRNLITANIYVRPMGCPSIQLQSFLIDTFDTPGHYLYTLPNWTKLLKVYCFGAGGNSLSSFKGNDGEFATASIDFTDSEIPQLDIVVGYGGGYSINSDSAFFAFGGTYPNFTHISRGGGLSSVSSVSSNSEFKKTFTVVAGGGASRGLGNKNISGHVESQQGQNSVKSSWASGGSGFSGGKSSCGLGSNGKSFCGANGSIHVDPKGQKYFSECSLGVGLPLQKALHGKVVLEIYF